MSCKIVKNQDGKINDVLDQSGNSSSLFKQILNTPTLSLDEAIAVYSNIYSEKLQGKVQFQTVEENNIIKRSDLTPIANQTVQNILEYNQYYKSKQLVDKGTARDKTKEFIKNSKFNTQTNPILSLGVPSEILKAVGISNTPITIPFKYFQEHLLENKGHNMTAKEVAEVMRAIHNPLAIYKNSENQEYARNNRYEILTPLKNKDGQNIIVILEVGRVVRTKGDMFGKQTMEVNTINTAFAEEKALNRFKYALDNNNVLFVNKKRIEESYLGGSVKSSVANRNDSINSSTKIRQTIETAKSFNNNLSFEQVKFQKSLENPVQELNGKAILEQLKKTGLAKNVFELSNEEIEAKLVELGVDTNIAKQVAQSGTGYYSNALVSLANLKDKNPKNIKGWLSQLTDVQKNGGIKNVNQELEWIGLEDYLNEYVKENNPKAGNIPSSVVEDYIKSNQIEIVDVSKGGFTERSKIAALRNQAQRDKNYDLVNYYDEEIIPNLPYTEPVKYEGYQLKGGENYREVLLMMPSKSIENNKIFTVKNRADFWKDSSNFSAEEIEEGFLVSSIRGGKKLIEKGYYIKTKEDAINAYREDNLQLLDIFSEEQGVEDFDFYDENGKYFNTITAKNIGQATSQYKEQTATRGDEYTSSHWSEKNILAHVRLNEKTLPDGRRVLVVVELQSDWNQQGKKQGFGNKEKEGLQKTIKEKEGEVDDIINERAKNKFLISDEMSDTEYDSLREVNKELANKAEVIGKELYELRKKLSKINTVPVNPFQKTDQWVGLVTRRVMQMATQEGYEGIAFATGQQSADMYSLAKQVDNISWDTSDNTLTAFDKNGKQQFQQSNVTNKNLEDFVGKEVAEKLIKRKDNLTEEDEGVVSLENADLEIGGEGMKTFYDKIVTKVAQKEAQRVDKNVNLEEVDFNVKTNVEITKKGRNFVLRVNDEFVESVDGQTLKNSNFENTQEGARKYFEKYISQEINSDKLAIAKQPFIPITDTMKEGLNQAIPLFQKEGIGLTTAGFTHNGNVYLNKDAATNETKVHEFQHLHLDWLKANRPEVYKRGLTLIQKELKLGEKSEIKDVIDFVKNSQPNLTGEALTNEILTELLGRDGLKLITELKAKKGGILEWLSEVWAEIKNMLGISDMTDAEVMELTLGEYARKMSVSVLKGNNIAQQVVEPNLSFETPKGETFDNYSDALKNTDEGTIKLKVEDVTLGEVSSSTDINTTVGSVNDLVKQGILKGERLLNPNGTITLVTEGNSFAKKLVNASISEEQLKGNKAKPSVDDRGDISIAETKSLYEEVKDLDYKQVKAKHGAEMALVILAARIYEENTAPFGQKRLIEDAQQITPENELQERLLSLLNTLGIKTVGLEKYKENYKQRNGVLPSSNALADIANRVIAFANGEVTQDALTEEVSHFIIEASNQEEIAPLLENIHKTDEWAQYAEEYFNIYQDEAIVRREILGKVLKNALQAKFAKSQQTGTANTIIGKLMDLVNKFFTRVSEFLTPQHIVDLNEYTQKIYDNLMLGELADELNQEQLEGNHLVLFQTSKNIQSEADLLLSKLNKALEHVEAQDRRLNSVSKEEILTLKEALKIENIGNEEDDIARATLGISNIANRQVNYLEKQAKKNLLSSEESAVFALTAGYLYKVLTELRSIISKKDGMPNKKLISDELDRTIANITKLQGDTNIAQEQNVQRIFDKVGDELGLSYTEKEQLLTNFNNIKRDTNVFYAYVGGAINAHNPALNIASALISKAYADRDIAFNSKMREFMKVTKDAGYTEEQVASLMSKWKRGHFLFSRFDFQKAEKDMLDEKAKLFKEVFGKDVTATQLEKDEDTLLKVEPTDKKKIYYKKVNDYRQENQVYTPLTEEETRKVNTIYAQVSLETQMKDKEFSRRRSSITREAKRNNGFSELEKFQMEELVRDRAILKNPFDNSGKLKAGLALDEEDNVSIAQGFTLDTLDADSKLVYELNLLDRLKGENFKTGDQETAVPLKFIKLLNEIQDETEKLEFIKANTNISFSSDFWNTFDRSEGVVAKLNDIGETTAADEIQKLTTRRKHILKANRIFNNPSEVNYADLSGETKKSLLEIEEALEHWYKVANEVLDKEDRVRNEMSESVTNQAYRDELQDRDLQSTEDIIEFIKQHTTPSNKVKIESARIAVEAYIKGFRKEVPKALQSYITSADDAEAGLIAYAETKLATYFKKIQPVGFDYNNLLVDIATNPETFFNNMPSDISVIPNYIFLGQEENKRVNPKFAKNIEDREPQLQLYDKNGNIKYGNKEFADYFGITNLENPVATKNQKEYGVLQALYKFQDDTIEKADMKDKHSRYLLPQKRPETLNRIANIKADKKGNLKEGFKELFAYREDDAIYGQTDGKMNLGVTAVGEMTIPRHGFNRMETADEVTNELLYSYMWMAQEAELRKSRVSILGDIESIRTILSNKSYGDKHGESTETYKMFTDFVNFNMYGQSESFSFETNFGVLSKKVNLAPLVKKFQWWIRLVNLGFSVLTPLTSFLQGSVNFQIEKVVGERIDKDAARLARKQLTKLLPESMSDVMKLTSSSKLNIISEFMGQSNSLERFKNSNYNRLTRGMAQSAYMTHATADAPLSAQVMLTVLHDFRIVNGKLTTFAKFAEENKSKTRKEARADWKAYEDQALFNYIIIENGVAKITDELRNKVPDIDVRMQSVRNAISIAKQEVDSQITGTDRTKMQRHALLSFLTLHKGWLITSMTRRFKSKHLNLYTGLEEEGSYSGTFGSDSFFSDLVQSWKKDGMNVSAIKETWNKSSVTRRRSMQRVAADIAVTNALVLMALLLKGMADDDEDKDFATQFAAYMSYRLASEVTSQSTAFSNQIYKFLQSPTTGLTQIQNVLDITDLISPNIIESGTYKDLSKRQAWMFKSLPALKEYWKLTNIDRTRKSYEFFNAPVIDYFSVAGAVMKEDKEKE